MMRRLAISAISLVTQFLAGSASAVRARRALPAECRPGHSHLITADAQAQVYLRTEGSRPSGFEAGEIVGCAYGSKRSYSLTGT